MLKFILALIAFVVVAIACGAAFTYSGIYNVGATAHHWSITSSILEAARNRSINQHAVGIAVPGDLDRQVRIIAGTAHFNEDCAQCHGAPGVDAKDLAEGMYPKPPSLKMVADRFTPAELFWILKHGIKMTGMPSWGDHSDDQLWNAVAFWNNCRGSRQSDMRPSSKRPRLLAA